MAEAVCEEAEVPAEEMFPGKKTAGEGDVGGEREECFPSEFPYDWVCLSGVGCSEVESSPTGGVNGECVAGLIRRAALHFRRDGEKAADPAPAAETRKSSSGEALLLSSPPPPPHLGKHRADAEIQLSPAAAAAEKQPPEQTGRGLLSAPPQPPGSSFTQELGKTVPTAGYYAYPDFGRRKDAIAQIQQLKRQQLAELQLAAAWRRQNRAKWEGGFACGRPARPPGAPTASPRAPHPPQNGSGMRAVFLGPGAGRESGGTGVFLPRHGTVAAAVPRKRPALSTVLLPARVMQALNLNLDDLGARPRPPGGSMLPQVDAIVGGTRSIASQNRTFLPPPALAAGPPPEVCLPAEWTY